MTGTGSLRFVSTLLFLGSGPLVWFAHLSILYGVAGFAPELVRPTAWIATFIAVAAIVALLPRARKQRRQRQGKTADAMREMTWALAALSLFAVLLQALVLGIVPK